MKVRTLALALTLVCGSVAGLEAAQPKHPAPILKPAKVKKPKNYVNKRANNSFQKSHNIKPPKAPKHPKAAKAKPPKAPKRRA